MNFSVAYAFLKQGAKIKLPDQGYSIVQKDGVLYWEDEESGLIRVIDGHVRLLSDCASTNWVVEDAEVYERREKIRIPFMKIRRNGWAEPSTPFHAHENDRGFDLTCVAKESNGKYVIKYHSGLAFEFPEGIDAELRARSSIYKTGLVLSNGVGTIDNGYRGEVMGVFYEMIIDNAVNHYQVGERFAQLVIPGLDPSRIEFVEVKQINQTDRGAGGYGSSGK